MSRLLDYYKTLNVAVNADIGDITSSYRQLCRLYHPDVSDNPDSEEMMKEINIAYDAICQLRARSPITRTTPNRRRYEPPVRPREPRRDIIRENTALPIVTAYFDAISNADYAKAYELLSDHDKKYVSPDSFRKWRKSVARVFKMHAFNIGEAKPDTVKTECGKSFNALKFKVTVKEDNLTTGQEQETNIEKFIINERGGLRVFLGYQDLRDIARVFEELFREKQKNELSKTWEEYFQSRNISLNMFSAQGLIREIDRELYRSRRYGGVLTLAIFTLKPDESITDEMLSEITYDAAEAINDTVRLSDVPAYIGNGLFAILYIGLKKKHVQSVTDRLISTVIEKIDPGLRNALSIDCTARTYTAPSDEDDFSYLVKKLDRGY